MKKTILLGITAMALLSFIGTAAPAGICLQANSPEAPADKIQCFEYVKFERIGGDYRFFPRTDRSVQVTAYRFRGVIPYKPDLSPTHPDFKELLKLYEKTAKASPSTRVFLNPKILTMRAQVAGIVNQSESLAKLPTITLANGSKLVGYKLTNIENGEVSVMHQDGFSRVKLTDLDAAEKEALNVTSDNWSLDSPSISSKDSSGTFTKIVFKNGRLAKNAKFKEVLDGNLVFLTSGGSVSIPADQFPGELSVLGEEVVHSLAQVKDKSISDVGKQEKIVDEETLASIQKKIEETRYYRLLIDDKAKAEEATKFLRLFNRITESGEIQKIRELSDEDFENYLRTTYLSIKSAASELTIIEDPKKLYEICEKNYELGVRLHYVFVIDPNFIQREKNFVGMVLSNYAISVSDAGFIFGRAAAWADGSDVFPLKSGSNEELEKSLVTSAKIIGAWNGNVKEACILNNIDWVDWEK